MIVASHHQNPVATPSLLKASRRVLEALTDLCRRHRWHPDQIILIGLDSHTWPDASLGVPEPGRLYAPTLTSGLVIRFQVGDAIHIYHTSLQGPPQYLAPRPPLALNEDHPLIAGTMLDLAQRLGVEYSRIEFDRAEPPQPILAAAQTSPTPETWMVWLRHGRQIYRYQGPTIGPLTLIDHSSLPPTTQ